MTPATLPAGERMWHQPERGAACQFVTDWVAFKATCGLSVDEVEHDAIAATLENCPERMVTVTPRELAEAG